MCVKATRYARESIGTSPYVVVRQIRSRNISAVSVMNKKWDTEFKVLHEFMNETFAIIDSQNVRNCTFIMDNAAIYRVGIVRDIFVEHGHS